MTYLTLHGPRTPTPQTEQAHEDQVENSAGGFSFKLDPWKRFERFLILGSEGGTYYTQERDLTKQNLEGVKACILEDGIRVVETIVTISEAGRAPKNDPALYALAMVFAYGDELAKAEASHALPHVARIGTHLFHFCQYLTQLTGWGRSKRRAVANWYLDKTDDDLAYQLVKYRQRDGWTHADCLRLSHPKGRNAAVLRWALGLSGARRSVVRGERGSGLYPKTGHRPGIIRAFEEAQETDSRERLIELIVDNRLTHEMVPNEWKDQPSVWEAMLGHMPLMAMVRNLGKMTNIGLLAPLGGRVGFVTDKLNEENICSLSWSKLLVKRSRIHPIQMLMAYLTYKQGHGVRGSLGWTPVPQIVDALEAGFYHAFANVEPTGKNTLLALDVSGSMGVGEIAGCAGLTPNIAAAAMAMVTARTESANYAIVGFSTTLKQLPITAKDTLESAMQKTSRMDFGGTDCALPMLVAEQQRFEVDVFAIYTDNETWFGNIHPHQALENYRKKMGIDAKLVVVAMTATDFSIANPNDPGMMDVVGFDSAAPAVIADFARGG